MFIFVQPFIYVFLPPSKSLISNTLPDGSDAIVMEGSGPFKVNYIDLRGGRKAEDFQPVGVKVENTPGIIHLRRSWG